MALKSYRWRLEEMLEDIHLVFSYTRGLELDGFRADPMRMDACVRRLSKLGEATKYLPERLVHRHPEVPWLEMRSVRNFLVHDYFGVSERALWITIHSELPRLERLLRRALETWQE